MSDCVLKCVLVGRIKRAIFILSCLNAVIKTKKDTVHFNTWTQNWMIISKLPKLIFINTQLSSKWTVTYNPSFGWFKLEKLG